MGRRSVVAVWAAALVAAWAGCRDVATVAPRPDPNRSATPASPQ
jgi:hypothetical protein